MMCSCQTISRNCCHRRRRGILSLSQAGHESNGGPGKWMEQGEPLSAEDDKLGHVSHSAVLYRSYLDSCFAYDPTCLKIDMAGDAYRWRRMMNSGVRVGFIRDVVTLIPLRPGEASRTIFQPD